MTEKPKCPMMMYGMPMMQGMQALDIMEDMDMPNMMNIPMMKGIEMEHHYADEEDDRYFMKLYSEPCRKMLPYVKDIIDRMEEKNSIIYEMYPEREMIRAMTDDAYKSMVKDMPDMMEEEENRQYPGRRFVRDLLGVLILNELFRRRRRYRRRYPHDYPYGSYGYEDDYDYYYYD